MRYSELENFFSTAEVFISDNTLRIRHSNFIVLAVAFIITHATFLGWRGKEDQSEESARYVKASLN